MLESTRAENITTFIRLVFISCRQKSESISTKFSHKTKNLKECECSLHHVTKMKNSILKTCLIEQ